MNIGVTTHSKSNFRTTLKVLLVLLSLVGMLFGFGLGLWASISSGLMSKAFLIQLSSIALPVVVVFAIKNKKGQFHIKYFYPSKGQAFKGL